MTNINNDESVPTESVPTDTRTDLQVKRETLAALESEHASGTAKLAGALTGNGTLPMEEAMPLFSRMAELISVDGKSGVIVNLRETIARDELDAPANALLADMLALVRQSTLADAMAIADAGSNFSVSFALTRIEGKGNDGDPDYVAPEVIWKPTHSFPQMGQRARAASTTRTATGATPASTNGSEDKYVLVNGARIDGVQFLRDYLPNAIRDGKVNWGPRDATPDARAATIIDNGNGRAHRIGQLARVLGFETNYA